MEQEGKGQEIKSNGMTKDRIKSDETGNRTGNKKATRQEYIMNNPKTGSYQGNNEQQIKRITRSQGK